MQPAQIVTREMVKPLLLTLLPKRRRNVFLEGPKGTGKSTMAEEIARELASCPTCGQGHAYAYGFNADSLGSHLLGGLGVDPDSKEGKLKAFVPGPATIAMGYPILNKATGEYESHPGVFIGNDLHKAGPGATADLYTVLDVGLGGTITLPNGDVFRPDPSYRVILTSNEPLSETDDAVADRVALRYQVLRPSMAMIESLRTEIRTIVNDDYDGEAVSQAASFREWQSLDHTWTDLTGASMVLADGTSKVLTGADALSIATLSALGDMARASGVLKMMQADDIPDAIGAVKKLISGMPSGV